MSYQSEVLADSPLGYWKFEFQGGVFTPNAPSTLDDTSGNGRSLTNSGIIVGRDPAALIPGNSGDLTSGASNATIASPTWLSPLTSYSVEAWVKTSKVPGQTVAAQDGVTSNRKWNLFIGPKLTFFVFGTSGFVAPESPGNINDNAWHHIVGTVNGTAVKLYLDGSEVASATLSATPATPAQALQVGTSGAGVFAGYMDELAIYGTALSATRVAAHYTAGTTASSDRTGTVAGTLPALTGSASGTVAAPPVTGTVAAALPALTGSAAGTHTSNNQAGTVSGTLPALSASAVGTVAAPGGIDRTGTVAATLPALSASVVGVNGSTTIPPWTEDESGETVIDFDTPSGGLDVIGPLALPPAGFTERPIMRRSVVVPALHTITGAIVDADTGAVRVPDDVYGALEATATVEEVGVPHVIYRRDGKEIDATYYRGGITRVLRDRREEPFGDVTMELEFARITSLDDQPDSPAHPLWWNANRANVEIVLKKSDGTVRRGVWTGHHVARDTGNDQASTFNRVSCVGTLRQASTDVLRVPNMLDPTDIGELIPRALNGVTSRRYPKIPNVSTGIVSRQRGSWADSPLGHAQNLLSTAWTDAGNQWTVAKVEGSRWDYVMRLKKTTPSWTVTNGARGVSVNLTRDDSSIRNVIFGHGVAPNGYAWWNYKYPNLSADGAPLYPGSLMGLGDSGAGVTLWQQRARDLGYTIAVDGSISSSDVLIIKTIQRRYGLLVDGVIGPQTWAATFDVGGNGGDLSGVIRLPLAADTRTQYYLYNADGSVAGVNPDWDGNVIIYADDVDFGSGVTRAEGIQSAQQILEREGTSALTGRITLDADPREGSRLLIAPGDKITLVGFEQADRVLHITAVERDWVNLTVTLDVDEKSRDAMTVAQIRERDREARRDPARRPGNPNRRSRLDVDQVVPYDGESGAGVVPKFALFGGLWSVIRVPVSEVGRVASLDLSTTGPASRFCVALFGAPIQPAHLVKYVGNPLASADGWKNNRETLEDTFGWIEGVGSPDQAAGYWPGLESDGDPLTGRLVDTGGFEYVSHKPPWVWVAFYAQSSCSVQGRILPAPVV